MVDGGRASCYKHRMTKIAVVNQSSHVTSAEVRRMVVSIRKVARELDRLWGWAYTPVRFSPADDAITMLLVDNADVANALAYHDVDPHGKPYGRVFTQTILSMGGSVLGDKGDPSLSVSAALAHEWFEWKGDPRCNRWVDMGDSSVAEELCDPVQADVQMVDGVAVSNAVLPDWFNDRAPHSSRFDLFGKLTRPFTMDRGGYWIEMTDGGVRQVFADGAIHAGAPHRAEPGARDADRDQDAGEAGPAAGPGSLTTAASARGRPAIR
jgi:hypothetical protein